jgi:AbrB family looped-hinge helix DNA binding protein
MQAEIQLGGQGRLVIPASLRRALGLDAGDRLVARLEIEGGRTRQCGSSALHAASSMSSSSLSSRLKLNTRHSSSGR